MKRRFKFPKDFTTWELSNLKIIDTYKSRILMSFYFPAYKIFGEYYIDRTDMKNHVIKFFKDQDPKIKHMKIRSGTSAHRKELLAQYSFGKNSYQWEKDFDYRMIDDILNGMK